MSSRTGVPILVLVIVTLATLGATSVLVAQRATPSITLSCYEQDSAPDLSFQDLKITAIEGSSLSNAFLALP